MRIAHEAPLSIFDDVQKNTDYDYFLVHLFEENEDYWQKAQEAVAKGRHVILDNSIFELGQAFDSDLFLDWINKLKPTEYIIPDVLEDSIGTSFKVGEWVAQYEKRVECDAKKIGVVQGNNEDDIIWCYKNIKNYVDKIAFSFDYSFLCTPDHNYKSDEHAFMRGRQQLIDFLLEENVIDTTKPHHLLGCFCPQEFIHYRKYDWIDTIDTSNPVVTGYKGIRYEYPIGLFTKPTQKLYTIMNSTIDKKQEEDIFHNINVFRKFCK